MAPRISAEMVRAIQMIREGANRYQAAKATGLTVSAITRSKLYKAWLEEQQQAGKA
jgi:hypothetical protein